MILGIGTDLTNIDRVGHTLTRFGDRFRQRVFTADELTLAAARRDEVGTLARRWAAKEACAKALGTGMRLGICWRDMGVVTGPQGAPVMALTGQAAARLASLLPSGHGAVVHLSLTDDPPWAQAFVVIEARAAERG